MRKKLQTAGRPAQAAPAPETPAGPETVRKPSPDPDARFARLLIVQAAVCAALVLAAWGLRSAEPVVFDQVSAQYRASVDRPVDYPALWSDALAELRLWWERETARAGDPAPPESVNADR